MQLRDLNVYNRHWNDVLLLLLARDHAEHHLDDDNISDNGDNDVEIEEFE